MQISTMMVSIAVLLLLPMGLACAHPAPMMTTSVETVSSPVVVSSYRDIKRKEHKVVHHYLVDGHHPTRYMGTTPHHSTSPINSEAHPMFVQHHAIVRRSHSKPFWSMHTGSLKENIQQAAAYYGWPRVEWQVPSDYRWVGNTRIRTHSLFTLLNRVIKDYPIQAVFYKGNHVVVIVPRTL